MILFWSIVAAGVAILGFIFKQVPWFGFSFSALINIPLVLLGLPQVSQILFFLAIGLVAYGWLQNQLHTRYITEKGKWPISMKKLVGQTGTVSQTIRPFEGGRVIVLERDWKAQPASNGPIKEGEPVEVVSLKGTTLVVEPRS